MSRTASSSRVALGVALAALSVLVATPRLAAQSVQGAQTSPPRGTSIFPRQAMITEAPGALGLVRLPLGPEVLEGVRADLGDVRVHDLAGEEVAYAIDRGDVSYPSGNTSLESRVVVAYDAQESTQTSAGVTRTTERYRIRPPSPPSYGGSWELLVEPEPAELVREVVVRAEPPLGEAREVTRTSIFRFARYGNQRLVVPLPGVTDEPLAIELSGEGRALHPRFLLRQVEQRITQPPTTTVTLPIVASRREGTRTIVTAQRPPGLRAISITLSASTPSFVREVEVRGRARVIGTGSLVRLAGVEIPELRTIALDEPLGGDAGGDTLEISIEDGDSPALTDLSLTATLRVPALLFDAGRAHTLRWGGHRARAPRYDLMSRDIAGLVRDGVLSAATIGPIEDNPDYDARPALGFAMRAGQVVDLQRSTHTASLTVPESPDALTSVAIPATVWAEAREDLADLRVIDAERRQWPYLLSPTPTSVDFEAPVAAAVPCSDGPRCSRHEVSLPARVMTPTTLRLELSPQLVARSVTVKGRTERDEEVILGLALFYSERDEPARLTVDLMSPRVTAVWLEIEDGDEAPLPIEHVTLVQPAQSLLLVAPAGEYTVLVGDADAVAPSYDLARAWELLGVLEPQAASLGALTPNPAFREPTFFERSGWEGIVLSALLGLVVLVLFGMTLHIARSEPPTTPIPAAATPAASEVRADPADASPPQDTTFASSDAEPSTAEPSTAEPSTAEPSDAEPSTAEPSDAEPSTAVSNDDAAPSEPDDSPQR